LRSISILTKEIESFINELIKLDLQLVKHEQEMKEFEAQSKQNRSRLLSGIFKRFYMNLKSITIFSDI